MLTGAQGAEAWARVEDLVTAADFYLPAHQEIFRVIAGLVAEQRPIDAVTVGERLELLGKDRFTGGLAYVAQLAHNTPSIANVRAYAEIVRERSMLRQVLEASRETANQALDPQGATADQILDQAEQRVLAIRNTTAGASAGRTLAEILPGVIDTIDHKFNNPDEATGLRTGYTDLDKHLGGGMQDTDLIVLAGRPSMGKTTFAMNLVENAVQITSKAVVVFSLEMPAASIANRMLASLGRLDQTRVRTGRLEDDDWPRLTAAANTMNGFQHRLIIDDTAGVGPAYMRSVCRRVAREHDGIALVMVDYLQLMQMPDASEGRTNEVSAISRGLKALAKEFNCPVVALSQLNRGLESRPNKRPINSDLRESGAIEQDADVIMFVYRDEVYHPDTEYKGVAEIIIGKQRNGPLATTRLAFQGAISRFDNLAPGSVIDFDNERPTPKQTGGRGGSRPRSMYDGFGDE